MVLLPFVLVAATINSLLVLAAAPRIAEREEAQAAREPLRPSEPVEIVAGL